MLEILQYVLGGFWRFIGFTTILYITLFFGVNGIINLVKVIKKQKNERIK
jgi:hypothetical protein